MAAALDNVMASCGLRPPAVIKLTPEKEMPDEIGKAHSQRDIVDIPKLRFAETIAKQKCDLVMPLDAQVKQTEVNLALHMDDIMKLFSNQTDKLTERIDEVSSLLQNEMNGLGREIAALKDILAELEDGQAHPESPKSYKEIRGDLDAVCAFTEKLAMKWCESVQQSSNMKLNLEKLKNKLEAGLEKKREQLNSAMKSVIADLLQAIDGRFRSIELALRRS